MDPRNPSCPCSLRRRPSLFSRARSGTHEKAAEVIGNRSCATPRDGGLPGKVNEAEVVVNDVDEMSDRGAYVGVTSQPPFRRKLRASFSGFSHVMADIRTFPKRLALQRKKHTGVSATSIHNGINSIYQDITFDDEKSIKESLVVEAVDLHPQSKAPSWLRRCVSTSFRHRSRTAETTSRPDTAEWILQEPYPNPVPLAEFGSPLVLDDNLAGAAARAAAAEQNEMRRHLLRLCKKSRCVRRDSESGIGIEIRPLERETSVPHLGTWEKSSTTHSH